MIIVYNPEDGAPILGFRFNGVELDPHFPDGYEFRNSSGVSEISKGLVQYEEDTALALLEIYQFLKRITPEEAQAILNRPPEAQYKCDFPGCDFSTHAKIALSGHKRKHLNEIAGASSPAIDSEVIPIAKGKKVVSRSIKNNQLASEERETKNGLDSDGVEWYGEGVEVESPNNFGPVKPVGKGHFQG